MPQPEQVANTGPALSVSGRRTVLAFTVAADGSGGAWDVGCDAAQAFGLAVALATQLGAMIGARLDWLQADARRTAGGIVLPMR